MTRSLNFRAPLLFLVASAFLLTVACGSDDPASEPSATAEPSPVPTATATPAVTPTETEATCERREDSFPADCPRPEVEVNRDFEIPQATEDQKALLDLLSRIPDTPENRESLMLRDVAMGHSLIGWERLSYEDGPDAWLERIMSEERVVLQLLPRGHGPFLSGLHRYTSQMKTYGSLGFDQRNVDQTVIAGTPPEITEIIAGRYDPELSAQLLSECDCPQPRVTEYGGYEYWSWGEEDYRGDLEDRLAPPLFDHVGRGGHVLITEDGLYRTLGEPLMRELIDTLNGDMPSLADDEELGFIIDVMGAHQIIGVHVREDDGVFTSGWLDQEGNEALKANATLAPFLKPFERMAVGTGWDGSQGFEALVLVNEDEETATENAERLVDRVLSSNNEHGLPWGTEISRVDVSVSGKYTIARFYSDRGTTLHQAINSGLLLAVE